MICEIGETNEGNYVIKGVESYKKQSKINNNNQKATKTSSMSKNKILNVNSLVDKSSIQTKNTGQYNIHNQYYDYDFDYDYGHNHNHNQNHYDEPNTRNKGIEISKGSEVGYNIGNLNVNELVLVQKYNDKSSSTLKNNKKKQEIYHPQAFSSSSSINTNHNHHYHPNMGVGEYSKIVNGIETINIGTKISKNIDYNSGNSETKSKKYNSTNTSKINVANNHSYKFSHSSSPPPPSSSSSSFNNNNTNNKRIEIRRKYYVKVTPINTKYIAIVKTITNNTPLLLCFEHGKDRHPKEIINLKNSNIYKGVTEKGPCICIRPKNESKYKTIEIVGENIKDVKKNTMTKMINNNNNNDNNNDSNNNIQQYPPKISSNSVTMYEVECHLDFDIWCNFFTSIGISLCSFRSLFHTTKLIGEGSFAKVYKGKNVITGEDVVLKAVDKKKVKESNVYTEIEVLRKVHHPHIVHFIASFEEEDHVCLVLEFLGGGELFEWIAQKGAYSEDQAKIAMKRVLLALQWLHANNVVHRDLKTENLILENRNCPESLKIIDFGLAASLGSPAMKMRCGSPGYVAPEILEDKIYSTKVDVFSIGVVLYTLLGGSPPFPGSNMKEILKKNIQGNVQFTSSRWKNISSSVKDLIKWMMAKDPESRCTAAQAIYHPWFEKIQLAPGIMVSYNNNNLLTDQLPNQSSSSNISSSTHSSNSQSQSQSSSPLTKNDQLILPNGSVNANITSGSGSGSGSASASAPQNQHLYNRKSDKIIPQDEYSTCLTNLPKNSPNKKCNSNYVNGKFYSSHSSNNPNINNKSSISISSLEYTDSQFSSSINSMKISPRSAIIPSSNQSNKKTSSLNANNVNGNCTGSSNNKLGNNISKNPSQIRSYCNSSNNNSISEKLPEVDNEDEEQKLIQKKNNKGGIHFELEESISKAEEKETNCYDSLIIHRNNESDYDDLFLLVQERNNCHNSTKLNKDIGNYYSGKLNHTKLNSHDPIKQPESFLESIVKQDQHQNFNSIYYAATVNEDSLSLEGQIPVIGNIITSSSCINNGSNNRKCNSSSNSSSISNNNSKSSSNNKSSHKTNRSSSIKAVLQNVFSRFSSNSNNNSSSNSNNNQSTPLNVGKKYEIN
ncbi:Ser Thr kinase [Cryptosporidium sp. chipmunk genotype I]|uniref:Ser Thr kinase n=1 Tax=Cryptosporidium sp. chipmunk genotype I TaxID=1280935 RepID=UPI00351A6555|nr:Ser Thr kinase [Cryptosporidium sp. chipmunk genotype I]